MAASGVNDVPNPPAGAGGPGPGADPGGGTPADAAVPTSVRPSRTGGTTAAHPIGVLEEGRRLASLKWRILRNTLGRSTWMLVGTVLGGVYALSVLALLISAMASLSGAGADVVSTASVLLGAALLVGWWVVPVLTSKADATLDPSRLALFPLSSSGLLLGQVVSAAIGVPGVLSVVAALGWLLSWREHPAALAVAVPCALFGCVLAFAGSRCTAALTAGVARGRRSSEIISLAALVLVVLVGPLLAGLAAGLERVWDQLPAWAAVLQWTPLGAVWAVPGDVASGAWPALLAHVLIGVVTLALLLVATRWGLERALADAAGGAIRTEKKSTSGLGLLARFPASPWGAVAARCLTYWGRDPRYSGSLIMIPALAAAFWFMGGETGFTLWVLPGFVALVMAYAISADISYDNTAFSLHLLAAVPGRADRLGRAVAMLIVAAPLVLLALALWLLRTGRWDALPAMGGVCLTLLLGGAGLVSTISARYTYPTPPPGASPLKTPQGFTILNALVQFATMGLMVVLALPAGALLVAFLVTGGPLWAWLGLAVGLVEGALLLWLGVVLGGRWLDARGPELLQEVAGYR